MENLQLFINEVGDKFQSICMDKKSDARKAYEEIFEKIREISVLIDKENKETCNLFNPLRQLFDVGENKMSDILAFLIDPKEKHGQGKYFLEKFISYFEVTEAISKERTIDHASVKREAYTNTQRKIDILININHGQLYLIIENKFLDAVDQENQCEDYYGYVKSIASKFNKDNVYLFYLTTDGRDPGNYTISDISKNELAGRLKSISFKDIEGKKSIATFIRDCKVGLPQKLQFFIDDIIHLTKEINPMDKYEKTLFEWLAESSERTGYVYKIYEIYERYRLFLIETILKKLHIELKTALGNEWEVILDEDPLGKNKGLKMKKQNWSNKYEIFLIGEAGQFNSVWYGLRSSHKDLLDREMDLSGKLFEQFQGNKVNLTESRQEIWWKWSELNDTRKEENVVLFAADKREETVVRWRDEIGELVEALTKPNDKIKELVENLFEMKEREGVTK